jgi:hypothetical protein
MGCGLAAVQAAPLPTNVAVMKAMVADDTVQQGRWGYRGGCGAIAAGATVPGVHSPRAPSLAERSRAAPIMAAIPITVDMVAMAGTKVAATTMDAIPTRPATAIRPIRTGATTPGW